MKKIERIYMLAACLLLWVAVGCQSDRPKVSDEQWHDIKAQLGQLDDSIARFSPRVLAMIDSGMRQAPDSQTYYAYYERMANYYLLTATPDSALHYADQTLAFCRRNTPNPRLRAIEGMALESKASYYQLYRSQIDSALSLHRQAYDALRQSDLPGLLITLSGNYGDAYALNNQLPEAAAWYRHAIFLADSTQVEDEIKMSLYMSLGRIYVNLKDFDSALHYYDLVGNNYDKLPPYQQSYYLNNYGSYFYYRHDYAEALQQFERLRDLLVQNGNEMSFDMFLCKINLADVCLNLGQTSQARAYVDEVEPFFTMYGVTDGIYYAHSIRIGLAARGVETVDVPALIGSEQAFPQPEQGLRDIRSRYLAEYYEAVGQPAEALRLLKHYSQANDSLTALREHMLTREHMMRLNEDTLRLHHSLALEEEKGATQRARMWVGLLVGILVLTVLAVLMWVNRSRKRRLQADLRITQLRLESIRQRISPHFILNVLTRHQHDDDDAQTFGRLTQLIRTNLEVAHQPLVSLKEELSFVTYYVHTACGDEIDYRTDVSPDVSVDQEQVPSMFVQILVENAIKHGLKGFGGSKTLSVAIAQDDGHLRIEVTNSGRPFDIRTVRGRTTGTGLSVIRETVAIYNERHRQSGQMDFSLSTLDDGTGCRATLLLPRDIKPLTVQTE